MNSTSVTGADITEGRADLVLNIEAMELLDRSFDTIICNHVLEHVDDKKALAEIFRVLSFGGRAVITVPIVPTWEHSFEKEGITRPSDRHLYFGQRDHVRFFGWDLIDRIKAAGFSLTTIPVTGDEAAKHSINRDHVIFLAEKPVVQDES
ncbi:hypothetical protein RCCS2_03909 [Roseobacter sp. CCS2]|nr:hypothetical protein RCCS2_03909 [Roseobacter sp. CCS2]